AEDGIIYITVSMLLDRETRTGAAMPNAIRHHAARHYRVENSGLRETRPAPMLGGGLRTSRPGGDPRDSRSESCGATAGSSYGLPVPRACTAANDNGNANNDGIRATPSGDKKRQADRLVTSESARASYHASRAGKRGLEVRCLSYQLDPRHVLVSDICFTARPGTMT